jgi:hypothetical protein
MKNAGAIYVTVSMSLAAVLDIHAYNSIQHYELYFRYYCALLAFSSVPATHNAPDAKSPSSLMTLLKSMSPSVDDMAQDNLRAGHHNESGGGVVTGF